jgi:hypothetical protein
MRALPTELARKLAANPRFRPAPASSLIIVGASGSEAERFSPHRRSEGLPSGGGTGQLGTSALVLVHLRHSRQTAPTCAQVAARQLLRPRGQTSRRAANGWRGRSWPREKSSNLLLCSAASRHARNNPAPSALSASQRTHWQVLRIVRPAARSLQNHWYRPHSAAG